ncbi:hypothetical protein ACP70R_042635 [Stipagrostis hirtigluma subsp. patula]
MGCYGLWPGDAVVLALYVLLVIVLLVTMIHSSCRRPADDVDGVQQRVPAPPETAAAAPSLPCFPYAAQEGGGGGGALETTAVCAICLEPLRRGQPCVEVPACRHAFHGDCARAWATSSNTCPLCRAKIAPGSDGAT